jgi:hypothetical protein
MYIYLTSTCYVKLLSKLSIIFKEWRVMNNVENVQVTLHSLKIMEPRPIVFKE